MFLAQAWKLTFWEKNVNQYRPSVIFELNNETCDMCFYITFLRNCYGQVADQKPLILRFIMSDNQTPTSI